MPTFGKGGAYFYESDGPPSAGVEEPASEVDGKKVGAIDALVDAAAGIVKQTRAQLTGLV